MTAGMGGPRRWAKVLVVNGVLATVIHDWDHPEGLYAIRCTIKTDRGGLVSTVHQADPFSQADFDRVGDEVVHNLVAHAHWQGMTPQQVSDGDRFTAMQHGSWICKATVDHQVAELDLALNGKRTPGVTLGMLLNQVRSKGFPVEVAAVLLEALEEIAKVKSAGVNPAIVTDYELRMREVMPTVAAAIELGRRAIR